MNTHDPCSNGPPRGVFISLNVSKVGFSMAMKKSRIHNLPIKDSHGGVSPCVHTAHSHATHSRGEDAGVCRVLAAPVSAPVATRDVPGLVVLSRTRGAAGKLTNGPSFVP